MSGGRAAYDSPTNKQIARRGQPYGNGFFGPAGGKSWENEGKNGKNRKDGKGGKEKGKGRGKGKPYNENKGKGKGKRYFSQSPDCGDPIVKMQNQLEICKLKG